MNVRVVVEADIEADIEETLGGTGLRLDPRNFIGLRFAAKLKECSEVIGKTP
ncbi:MAG TPA: hypothetical protein VF376_14105 [Thermoanaerobaculia bacterium]